MASVHRGLAQRCAWAATLLVVGASQLVAACSSDSTTTPESGGGGGAQGGEAGAEAGTDARGGAAPSAGGATAGQAGTGHGGSAGEGGEAGEAGVTGLSGGGQSAAGTAGAMGGVGGQPIVLCPAESVVAHSSKAWALALDGGYVYWTTRAAAGQVLRAPVGGGPTEIVASGQSFPYEVAAAGGQAFWATLGTGPGHLFQGPVTGSSQQELGTGVFNGIYSLWADQNFVYYITNLNDVMRVPVGGGTAIKLSAGLFNTFNVDLALQGSNLYWTNNGVNMFAATEPETAGVWGVDVAGATAAASLVTRLDYPQFEVAADTEHVFWSDGTAIYSTSKLGGAFAPVTSLAPAAPDVSPIVDLVTDGTHLFYSDGQRVYRVSVLGGTPGVVSAGWSRITRLAVDDNSLYFTDYVAGVVVKLPTCTAALTPQELGDGSQGGGGGSTGGGAGGGAGSGAGGTAGGGAGGGAGAGGSAGGSAACDLTANPHGCPAPTIAFTTSHPYGLALDADHLYFSTLDASGSVMRIPLGGSDAEPIATGEPSPFDIAVDDTNVYWCLADQPSGHVVMAPKAGGMRQQLAAGDAFMGVGRVTSDGTYAYYVGSFNVVYRVAVAGGGPAYVAAGPDNSTVNDVALYDGELFWANDGIYNSTFSAKLPGTGYVGRAPVTGSSNLGRSTLKTGLNSPVWRTAVDSAHVFAIDGGFVYRGDREGGGMTAIAPTTPASGQIYDMLSDGEYVYFIDRHAVYRLPVTGGTVETLSPGWTSLRSIAMNATDLYFTDFGGGVIMRRPK